MKAIQCKLRSRTGASLTFALLLFLVCSIISSVVIVAGSVTGGQLSQMAETDQRYYAVTSAAELLKNTLEAQSVKIVCETVVEKTYDTPTPGVAETNKSEKAKASVYFNDDDSPFSSFEAPDWREGTKPTIQTKASQNPPTILAEAACRMSVAGGNVTYDTGREISWPYKPSLVMDVSATSGSLTEEEAMAAKVYVQEVLTSDGTLKFYLYKSKIEKNSDGHWVSVEDPSNPYSYYTLLLTFRPVVDESTSTRKMTGTPEYKTENDVTTYTRKDTETTTTTTIYQWKLTGIQKSQKPVNPS